MPFGSGVGPEVGGPGACKGNTNSERAMSLLKRAGAAVTPSFALGTSCISKS
eukprot:CAMPEP_0179981064 /NCGR_PEP_ID=MMETSP0983-20121128/42311_1 /TAXON_ID=483367 /ORGANISM="non described non described, Strain CCMP 2436" /LENGTH=51 /DNA_ID=CAMNT_0021899129 /DNA_START=96 /DNA_END=247 /DNA_ORIENTATION=+